MAKAGRPRKYVTVRGHEGVIVTFARRDDGATQSITREGRVRPALRECLARFDPAEWRVVTISTPRTILADLRGRKTTYIEEDTTRYLLNRATRIERPQQIEQKVEAGLLGQVEALEYL